MSSRRRVKMRFSSRSRISLGIDVACCWMLSYLTLRCDTSSRDGTPNKLRPMSSDVASKIQQFVIHARVRDRTREGEHDFKGCTVRVPVGTWILVLGFGDSPF